MEKGEALTFPDKERNPIIAELGERAKHDGHKRHIRIPCLFFSKGIDFFHAQRKKMTLFTIIQL